MEGVDKLALSAFTSVTKTAAYTRDIISNAPVLL